MKSTLIGVAAGLAVTFGSAAAAQAQMQWTDQGFVSVNLGVQAPSRTLTTETTRTIYDEEASFNSTQDVGGGAFFDIAAGYKVWRNLAVGVGITRVGSTADLTVDARIPDPVFFDLPRSVRVQLPDAEHSQTAINLTGTWIMPVTDKIDVGYQFGPTIFLVSQDMPGVATVTEPDPTVSLAFESVDKTTMGIHFGVDVTYMVNPRFGFGGIARYTWGSADLIDTGEDSLTLGGFQIGGGLRVRF
jgi:hypothetical protein